MSLVEFEKAVQQRLIPSSVFLKKFAAELEREFGPAAAKAATMAQASVERFGIAIFALRARLSNRGVLDAFADSLDRITSWLSDNPDVFDRIGQDLGDIFEDVANWLGKFNAGDIGNFLDQARAKFKALYDFIKTELLDLTQDPKGYFEDIGERIGNGIIAGIKVQKMENGKMVLFQLLLRLMAEVP
jgi:hypothetical protein